MGKVSTRNALALAATVMTMASAACTLPVEAAVVELAVIDRDTGQPLPVYTQHGQRYVAGQPGHRYAVRVTNLGASRLLAVVSVDGINVVTGQTAHPQQSGYVFEPWAGYELTGWRKSDTEVAAFEFAALEDSYAARTGRPKDVGVIGVAAFLERVPEPPKPFIGGQDLRERSDAAGAAAPAPAAPTASPERKSANEASDSAGALARRAQSLGTAHGEREASYAGRTSFERSSRWPVQVLSIRYDSYEALVAQGVIPRPRLAPQPFPAEPGLSYVPDPPRRW